MAQPFIGEIRMFAGTFAPANWGFCDGTNLQIADYIALYDLIGTTYGGDGVQTFSLPDLRGRIPVHMGPLNGGSNYVLGQAGGLENVTLISGQIPQHTHLLGASSGVGYLSSPTSAVPSRQRDAPAFNSAQGTPQALTAATVGLAGGSQPHDNMPPFVVINFIIALFGIFPSPN